MKLLKYIKKDSSIFFKAPMGFGKTRISLILSIILIENPQCTNVVIMCPNKRILGIWEDECFKLGILNRNYPDLSVVLSLNRSKHLKYIAQKKSVHKKIIISTSSQDRLSLHQKLSLCPLQDQKTLHIFDEIHIAKKQKMSKYENCKTLFLSANNINYQYNKKLSFFSTFRNFTIEIIESPKLNDIVINYERYLKLYEKPLFFFSKRELIAFKKENKNKNIICWGGDGRMLLNEYSKSKENKCYFIDSEIAEGISLQYSNYIKLAFVENRSVERIWQTLGRMIRECNFHNSFTIGIVSLKNISLSFVKTLIAIRHIRVNKEIHLRFSGGNLCITRYKLSRMYGFVIDIWEIKQNEEILNFDEMRLLFEKNPTIQLANIRFSKELLFELSKISK
jgi:hypothetical protein